MKWSETKGTLGIMAVVFALMVLGGGAAFFYTKTLVEWWLPLGVAFCAALLLRVVFRGALSRRLTELPRWLRDAVQVACLTVAAGFAVLGMNYAFADDATLHEEQVTVERKFSEKHYRSRRVGRGRYTKGEHYYVYRIAVRFTDGRTKTFDLPMERYNRVRQGAPLALKVETGLLGWPVIRKSPLRAGD